MQCEQRSDVNASVMDQDSSHGITSKYEIILNEELSDRAMGA